MSDVTSRRRNVAVLGIACGALFISACNEKGLPGKNRPLADVQNVEWRYPVYEKTAAAKTLMEIGGHTWQITGAMEAIPANMLQPVTTVNGDQIYSLKSDNAPYDRLYTTGENGKYSVVSNIN